MEYKDYYKTLGVEKSASDDEIKKQYRRLARKYHPDVSKEKDAEEKFKDVREAYEVLKDPEKRKAYDQMGSNWKAGQGFTPPPGWDFHQYAGGGGAEQFGDSGEFGGFSDFFENLFGQGQRARGAGRGRAREHSQRGQDLHTKISLSLEDAFSGTQRMIQLQEPALDPATGRVHYKTRSLKVKIPAGVTNGQQIRLAKQGGPGIGQGANGDVYLEIQLAEHPLYTVKDRDVYINLPVTPWEAALGAKVEVPTLGGKVGLTIPAASQTGNKLRLKGRGLPGTTPGDQYVLLMIYTPAAKTDGQRELYQKMAEAMPYNPRAELIRD